MTDPITALLTEIDSKQQLVAKLVEACPDARWHEPRQASDLTYGGVAKRGHFPGRSHQLGWSPAQVAMHLVDATRLATLHINQIRDRHPGDLRSLPVTPPKAMGAKSVIAGSLDEAQQELIFRAASLHSFEFLLTGVRDKQRVSVTDVLAGTADHDADHAHQLVVQLGGS